MHFSKFTLRCLTLLMCLLVGACSVVSKKGDDKEKEAKDAATLDPDAEPVFQLIPNPYKPGNVPGPAKQEYAKIKTLMENKKWVQAKGLLELMAETYPNLSGPYVNLGIVHHKLGEYEQAEKALSFAIETNPQNFDAYTRLGLLFREQGKFQEAEKTYLQALEVWPHHLPSVTNLGILYDLYMGRFGEALACYELGQQILGGEDRQIKGWIADLKRRIGTQQ